MADFNANKKQFRQKEKERQKTPQNEHFQATHSGKTYDYVSQVIEQRDNSRRNLQIEYINQSSSLYYPNAAEHVFYYSDLSVNKMMFENECAINSRDKIKEMNALLREEIRKLQNQN